MASALVMHFGILAACALFSALHADTPANCSYYDVEGSWTFYESSRGHNNHIDCSTEQGFQTQRQILLKFPSLAVNDIGNEGYWTLIYNQGFEIVLGGRKYFVFLNYDSTGSICNTTNIGWSHNLNGADWACVAGIKGHNEPFGLSDTASPTPAHHIAYKDNVLLMGRNINIDKSRPYVYNADFINKINQAQTSWRATKYSTYESMTLEDLFKRSGGRKSKIYGVPKSASPLPEQSSRVKTLPDAFDWRNIDNVNFISPVRDQGKCGSCYAFASMALVEARQRIYTNNTIQNIYSPQDVVECSSYSQGCEGGFPYLIAGKYGEDFGVADEACNPYKGVDSQCSTSSDCARQYTYNYQYIGGYYGACSEEAMKIALVQNGPIAVSFEVYDDFLHYSGGVYYHTYLEDHFNPFEITNHVVLIVGYGTDPVGGPYWIVKNSWGASWGEKGYFRIRRGWDECSIESIAVEILPVV